MGAFRSTSGNGVDGGGGDSLLEVELIDITRFHSSLVDSVLEEAVSFIIGKLTLTPIGQPFIVKRHF